MHLGLVLIPILPRCFILKFSKLVGIIGYYCVPSLRKITLTNLDIAFKDEKNAVEKKQIAIRTFINLVRVILDIFWFSKNKDERIAEWVKIDEDIKRYLDSGPKIGVTAHFGNWELISQAISLAGYAHTAVAATLANSGVDRLYTQFRSTKNVTVAPRTGAVRYLIRALKKGEHIALLLDQNTRPDEGGIFVKFFSLNVPTSTAAAVLAERMDVPILMVFCIANEDGSYRLYAHPPKKVYEIIQEKDTSESIRLVTQWIVDRFEDEIRKAPEQWMWMYKRWKHRDPAEPETFYPFYSKPLRK